MAPGDAGLSGWRGPGWAGASVCALEGHGEQPAADPSPLDSLFSIFVVGIGLQGNCGVRLRFYFLKYFIYLFLERGEWREKKREGNVDQLPFPHPQLGSWSITLACAQIGN